MQTAPASRRRAGVMYTRHVAQLRRCCRQRARASTEHCSARCRTRACHTRTAVRGQCVAARRLAVAFISTRASACRRFRECRSATVAADTSRCASWRASCISRPLGLGQRAHTLGWSGVAGQWVHSLRTAASAAWRAVAASACTCCGVSWPGWPSACARACRRIMRARARKPRHTACAICAAAAADGCRSL